jgi:hypothetical protein
MAFLITGHILAVDPRVYKKESCLREVPFGGWTCGTDSPANNSVMHQSHYKTQNICTCDCILEKHHPDPVHTSQGLMIVGSIQ